MTDIVQTLRSLADEAESQQAPHNYVLHLRAGADEIERLRAALMEIYKSGLFSQGGAYKKGFYENFKIARRALRIPHMGFSEALAALEARETGVSAKPLEGK